MSDGEVLTIGALLCPDACARCTGFANIACTSRRIARTHNPLCSVQRFRRLRGYATSGRAHQRTLPRPANGIPVAPKSLEPHVWQFFIDS
jgi:hypothetical protein